MAMVEPSVLFVQLDKFYIRTLRSDATQPTLIHRDKLILDANDAAAKRGVHTGMGLPEAKAILGKEGAFVPWQEESFRVAQTAWLDICAKHADAIEPVDQHQAYIDLSDHPDSQDIRRRLVSDLTNTTGLSIRHGLASCRWIAKIAAFGGNPEIAVQDPELFVSQLPVMAMPIPEQFVVRLGLLGCRSISDVAAMSIDTLRRQFGKEALSMQRIAKGNGESKVQAIYPPDCIRGRFSFDGAASDLEVFDNGLKHLAKSIGTKLIEKDSFGEVLEIWLEDEGGEIVRLSRKFSKPIGSIPSLLVALRLLCGTMQKPIARIRIQIPNLKKANRVQKTLDNFTAMGAKQDANKTAVAHVKAAFGDRAIQLASEVHQPRWKLVRKAWGSANGWTWR
jgi:nucleotidyltransferase/DNA polymerase involved in DNA repair